MVMKSAEPVPESVLRQHPPPLCTLSTNQPPHRGVFRHWQVLALAGKTARNPVQVSSALLLLLAPSQCTWGHCLFYQSAEAKSFSLALCTRGAQWWQLAAALCVEICAMQLQDKLLVSRSNAVGFTIYISQQMETMCRASKAFKRRKINMLHQFSHAFWVHLPLQVIAKINVSQEWKKAHLKDTN